MLICLMYNRRAKEALEIFHEHNYTMPKYTSADYAGLVPYAEADYSVRTTFQLIT